MSQAHSNHDSIRAKRVRACDLQLYDTIHLTEQQSLGIEEDGFNNLCHISLRCYLLESGSDDDDEYQLYSKHLVPLILHEGDIIIFMGYRRIPITMAPWNHMKGPSYMNVAIVLFNGHLRWMYRGVFDKMSIRIVGHCG